MTTHSTPLNQLFRCAASAPDTNVVPVRTETHHRVPKVDDAFVIERENLSDFLAWFHNSTPADFLFITGPTGAGKSSLVRHMAGKMNVPLWEATGHEALDVQDLLSQRVLIGGDLVTQHGPLTQAYLNGGWFCLNEVDLVHPSRLVSLNEVGTNLTLLDMGGEMIEPHQDFRLILTGNSNLNGDATGLYAGVLTQNKAFADRCVTMRVGYPSKDVEAALIEAAHSQIPEIIRTGMIEVANLVRGQFAPHDENGNPIPGTIEKTISTRGLLRWAALVAYFYPIPSLPKPLTHSLDRAIAFGAEPGTRQAMHELVQRVFGDDERNPKVLP